MIRVKFSYLTRFGQYSDVLILPRDHGLTKNEIQQLKIERRDRWVEHMRKISKQVSLLPTPPVVEPVVEKPAGE